MVCERMGLLDEAIREHLALKRLGGADPGQVARKEHEAFGDVLDGAMPDDESIGAGQQLGNVGQETVELDMAAVLYSDAHADALEQGVEAGDSAGHADKATGVPSAIPGQERFGFG
jgi:hypothetical protein